jgi:hypothetical protein
LEEDFKKEWENGGIRKEENSRTKDKSKKTKPRRKRL